MNKKTLMIFAFLMMFALSINAYCASACESEQPKSASTAVDVVVTGGVVWQNPSNALASDSKYATATTTSYKSTDYLKITNFGFSIPSGCTITGIKVEIERHASSNSYYHYVRDKVVSLVKNSAITSANKAYTTLNWLTCDTYKTYGSSADLWGETWTSADINSPNFGVVLQALIDDATAYVNHIRITVYYSHPCTPVCGNSVVETGEDCDGGECCNSSCKFKPASTVCRASAGVCDEAEYCTGSSAYCPSNSFLPDTTECDSWAEYGCTWGTGYMSDVGTNSRTRFCTGSSANCTGAVTDSWTVYQDCATCEYCKVVGSDPKQSNYAVCANSATSQKCDDDYECAQTSGDDYYVPNIESPSYQYNTQGYCDGSGNCDYATGQQCTGIEPNWCRPLIAGCNNYCNSTYPYDDDMDGLNNTCDADCCENCDNDGDEITDVCDPDDDCFNCTTHPDNQDCNDKDDSTNVCGGAGTSTICSEDPSSETSDGTCVTCSSVCSLVDWGDQKFYCDGASWQTGTGDNFVCRQSGGVCDIAEYCDGAGNCPSDSKSTSECRAVAGDCDIAEYCDGVNNNCPSDIFEPSTTICREPDTYCPGNGPYCPEEEGYCGDGTIDTELGEECDNGTSNGVPCTPPYDGSCSYCNSSCEIITLNGPYCGDGNCDEEEDEDNCPEDCEAPGPNATLAIYDSAEGSYVTPNTAVTYFALYKNATSNTHIYGATCYAEDEDGTYLMIEIPGGYYYYIKYGGFMYTGTKDWNVTCSAAGFPSLSENDDLLVHAFYGVVPEFSDYAIVLIVVTAICGFYFVRRRQK